MALLLRATGLLAAAGNVPLPPAPGWEYVGGAWAEDKANGGVARERPHPTRTVSARQGRGVAEPAGQ